MMADGLDEANDNRISENERSTALRAFAYDPVTRAAIAIEQALRLCPACAAEQTHMANLSVRKATREIAIGWRCQGAAVVMIGQDGAITARHVAPCLSVTRNGVMAAIEAGKQAFLCEDVLL